jgi:hypothetical protein
MASERLSDGRPAYARFLLLLLGEAVAGICIYAVFTFMPTAVQMPVTFTAWVIVAGDNILHPRKNKSLAALLCAITAAAASFCGIEWRITNQDFWSRLMLTGLCLMATLIFLDRRWDD